MAMQRDYSPPEQVRIVAATVPMPICCRECGAAMVRAALHGACGVRGVVVDLRNQQVTVTGYHRTDLLQALQLLTQYRSTTTTRGGDRRVVTRYTRTQCPVYRAGASDQTHYVNPA